MNGCGALQLFDDDDVYDDDAIGCGAGGCQTDVDDEQDVVAMADLRIQLNSDPAPIMLSIARLCQHNHLGQKTCDS